MGGRTASAAARRWCRRTPCRRGFLDCFASEYNIFIVRRRPQAGPSIVWQTFEGSTSGYARLLLRKGQVKQGLRLGPWKRANRRHPFGSNFEPTCVTVVCFSSLREASWPRKMCDCSSLKAVASTMILIVGLLSTLKGSPLCFASAKSFQSTLVQGSLS